MSVGGAAKPVVTVAKSIGSIAKAVVTPARSTDCLARSVVSIASLAERGSQIVALF